MNRQQSGDLAQFGQDTGEHVAGSSASPATVLGTINASTAGPLAARWQTPLRRASVPLLPAPELEAELPVEAVAAGTTDTDARDAPVSAPSPATVAPGGASSFALPSGRGPQLRLIMIVALVFIVLVLAVLFRSFVFHT